MRRFSRPRCVVFFAVPPIALLLSFSAGAQENWTMKVVASRSGLPVPGADITIYPGGKEKGPNNKHLFATDARGRAVIPVIRYEKTAPNDFANIMVSYQGEQRAHVVCGPETLRGDQESVFVVPLSGSRRVDEKSKISLRLGVTDFRPKSNRKYWQIRVSGQLPGVPPGAAEWWWYLEPVEDDGETYFRGDVPRGLKEAKLHLDSRGGVALMYEDAQHAHYYCQPSVRLGTIDDGTEAGNLSFYPGASVVVRVLDPDGEIVNDASVDAYIRSSVVRQGYAKFRPLRQGTEGKYVSPPMTNLSVAAIRAIHTVYAEARMETKAVRRGGKMEVDIQLKPVEGPESGDDSLPDFIRERARMDVVRPGSPIPEWPSGAAGPTRSGLRAVLKLEPLRDTYSIGDTIECWFVVQNAGDEPIEFSTLTFIQDAKAEAFDLNDEPIEVQSTWFSGVSPHAHFRLAPGEQVEIRASSIGIGKGEFSHPVGSVIEAKAGDICRLQFEFKIPGVQGSDGSGRVTVPAAGEWIGRMKTGEVQFRVVDKEQPEDSRDGS